jgi:hypothetical protein
MTSRPIQPRFHYASGKCLKLPCQITRWIVLQKARCHRVNPAPTPCTHTISGSISLPFRGSFNLSLTVLVHYRSQDIFSLGGWSPQLPTGFLVSRGTRAHTAGRPRPSPTGLSPSLARRSRRLRVGRGLVTAAAESHLAAGAAVNPAAATRDWYRTAVGLGLSPFARHYLGNLG